MTAPLLLIPGAFCGAWAFDELRPALAADGREVRAIDLPGHGAGDAPAWLSVADYARAVATEMARFSEPPVLVGHSMGGLVAQLAAARARTAGLVLLAPSPAWGQPVSSAIELGAGSTLAAVRGPYWAQAVDPDWSVVREFTLDQLPLAEARAIYARMTPESGRALWEILNWWLDPSLASAVPPLSLPALVIAGALDRVHSPATTEAAAQRLNARHIVLPGVSHWTLSGPGTPAGVDAIRRWLAELEAQAAPVS